MEHERYIRSNGYVCVWCPSHPKAFENGYVPEHILVAGNILGRDLTTECVHHIDEDKQNNNPENLIVFESKSEHTAFHKLTSLGHTVTLERNPDGTYKCLSEHRKYQKYCKFCGKMTNANSEVCRKCLDLYVKSGKYGMDGKKENGKKYLNRYDIPSFEDLKREHESGTSYLKLAKKYNTSYQTIRARIRKEIV